MPIGTYVYPTAYFSNDGEGLLRQRPQDDMKWGEQFHINGIDFFVREDGYLIIKSEDVEESSILCNCLFLSMNLLGYERHTGIRAREFEILTLNEIEFKITSKHGSLCSERSAFYFSNDARAQIENARMIVYPIEVLNIMIELGTEIYNSEYRERILMFFDAWSAIGREERASGFILSWVCLELLLWEEMQTHLNGLGISSRHRKKILDWKEISKIIDFLYIEIRTKRLLPEKKFDLFTVGNIEMIDDLRKARNQMIHNGKYPTKEEADQCLNLATKSLWRYIVLSGINYNSKLERVRSILPDRGIMKGARI